jgi:peptide chain release factor-like protein
MYLNCKRTKLFSVTIKDCRVDTFTVGGHGGAGKDTSNTGVRVVHEPSGAKGESTETRSQAKNKSTAFKRMAQTPAFVAWVKREAARLSGGKPVEEVVEELMEPHNIIVEVRDNNGKWVKVKDEG